MAARDLIGRLNGKSDRDQGARTDSVSQMAPFGGTRAEAIQRLQVGLTGLCAMIFIIGVASAIGGQADIAEEAAVPDAAPTTEPSAASPQRDPLADAGVVPDIPAQPEAAETGAPPGARAPAAEGSVTVPDTPPTEALNRGARQGQ